MRGVSDAALVRRRLDVHHRKRDGERAALTWCARDSDAAAVRVDDPPDQAEPETGALDLRGDDGRGAIERLEDAIVVRDGDPDAAVAHRDLHGGGGRPGADPDPLPAGPVLDRIADQIDEHAPQCRLITG